MKPRVGAIAFFDLPGSTRAMKKDPHAAVPRMILHNSLCGAIIRLHEGTIVKELGDGLVARFDNAGDAVVCAVRVIRNLRERGGGVCTRATVAFGTLWDVRNSSGEPVVYGTPVHVIWRMEGHAVENAIVIDGKDRESALEWFRKPAFGVRPLRKKLRDYPDRRLCLLSIRSRVARRRGGPLAAQAGLETGCMGAAGGDSGRHGMGHPAFPCRQRAADSDGDLHRVAVRAAALPPTWMSYARQGAA